MPVFRYHSHIYSHIDRRNRYSYTNNRRLVRADRMYNNVRGNSLERQNPNRSFASRNQNVTNRRALESTRDTSRSRNSVQAGNSVRGSNRSESVGRLQNADNRAGSSGRSATLNSGRQRVSSEEFSRNRASNANIRSNRATIQNRGNIRSGNSSSIRRESAPA